jgi:5-methylthioadenosine/S-adenosylhomocysteine deaminase
MKLLALQSSSWDALAAATLGGAAAAGMDTDIGSLAPGKWADLCCIDLGGPATQPLNDPVTQLVLCGGRDLVNDVWVAGRHLLSEREMTRLDWAAAAERARAWAERLQI